MYDKGVKDDEMKNYSFFKKYLGELPLFFCVLACISGVGKFFALALTFLVAYLLKNKKRFTFDFKNILRFRVNIFFILCFIISLLLVSFVLNNQHGIKESLHYFGRMLPFFFVIFFIGNNNLSCHDRCVFVSMCIGVLVAGYSYWYNYLTLEISRANGMLGSVNIFGGTIILVLPFIVALTYKLRNNILYRILGLITVGYLLLTLLMIQSRGALLGLGALVTVYIVLLYKIKSITFKQFFFVISLEIICASVCYFYFYDLLHRGYDYVRPALWQVAWNIFNEYPITGIGFGNYSSKYVSDVFVSPLLMEKSVWTHAHNIYLKFLSETGIIGFCGFIALIISQMVILWKNIYYGNDNFYSISMFLAISGMLIHGWFDVCFSARYYAMTYWLLWGLTTCDLQYWKEV